MKYKKVVLPIFYACTFCVFCAFKFWNSRSILTSAPWTSVEIWNDFDMDGIFVLDTTECRQDNDWIFSLNGNLVISEDAISCEPETPEMDTVFANWSLENYDTRLNISFTNSGSWLGMNLFSIGPNEVEFHYSGNDDPNDTVTRQRIILRR